MKIQEVLNKNKIDYSLPFINEWVDDITTKLPNKPYQGNCTKEFCDKIMNEYIDKEYNRVKQIEFPNPFQPIPLDKCSREILSIRDKDRGNTTSWTIRKFHPNMYKANIHKTLSPYDGWQKIISSKEEFRNFYANRLRCSDYFKEKDHYKELLNGYVPDFIYGIGLSTSKKYPCVTYFKPDLAKYIIKNYLNEYNEIFDPFSGYSGRLIGALVLNKKYIGQDLCEITVKESNECGEFVASTLGYGEFKISNKDSIQSKGEYECLFTCPPYGLIENWPGIELKDRSCDEWIDICINNYKCNRYVFVVDNLIDKYKPCIKEELTNTSHFGSNNEYIISIDYNDLF